MIELEIGLAFLLGAGLVWGVREREMCYLRDELRIAQDRLLHAWRDERAIIPPRPQPPPEPAPALPPELMELVNDWESPAARHAAEAKYRRLHFEQGWGVQAILRDAEDNHTGMP